MGETGDGQRLRGGAPNVHVCTTMPRGLGAPGYVNGRLTGLRRTAGAQGRSTAERAASGLGPPR
eukprot:15440565-Alexandrium_andersonii.AAC.1